VSQQLAKVGIKVTVDGAAASNFTPSLERTVPVGLRRGDRWSSPFYECAVVYSKNRRYRFAGASNGTFSSPVDALFEP